MAKRDFWKIVSIIELIIIIILFFFLQTKQNSQEKIEINEEGLLSPRVYAGILPAESKLIFNFDPLENVLREYIDQRNKTIGFYIMNMRDSASMGINENVGFEPASLNKVVMAILILRSVERGYLDLETELPIKSTDRDAGSGYLYKTTKTSATIQELLDLMLNESDNTAFRVLGHQVKEKDWNALTEYLDYYENIDQDLLSKPSYKVTPVSNSHLFTSLYLSTFLQQNNSEYILRQLTKTSFDIKKIAALPEEIIVAQKFGEYYSNNESYFHSCGIMYVDKMKLFYCVMTKDMPRPEAEIIIGDMVQATYQYLIYEKANIINNFDS